MFTGAHLLLYSKDAEADRAFFRDVLQFRAIDIGRGWLLFKLPPTEAAVHPVSDDLVEPHAGNDLLRASLYLMCDDLPLVMRMLAGKNVECTEVRQEAWGTRTTVRLPSGGEIGLYQPSHPTALNLD